MFIEELRGVGGPHGFGPAGKASDISEQNRDIPICRRCCAVISIGEKRPHESAGHISFEPFETGDHGIERRGRVVQFCQARLLNHRRRIELKCLNAGRGAREIADGARHAPPEPERRNDGDHQNNETGDRGAPKADKLGAKSSLKLHIGAYPQRHGGETFYLAIHDNVGFFGEIKKMFFNLGGPDHPLAAYIRVPDITQNRIIDLFDCRNGLSPRPRIVAFRHGPMGENIVAPVEQEAVLVL